MVGLSGWRRRRLTLILLALSVILVAGFLVPRRDRSTPSAPVTDAPAAAPPATAPAAEAASAAVNAAAGGSADDPAGAAPAPVEEAARPGSADHPPAFPARVRRVAVLMYHEVGNVENPLYVRPEELAAHIEHVVEAGYSPVTLQDVYDHFSAGAVLPDRPVVFTFDDGYASAHHAALPLLQAHGFPATVFVITDLVGSLGYLTWDEIDALASAGWEIGSHTLSHPDLTLLSPAALRQQVVESKLELERRLGISVHFFCYPAGRVSPAVVGEVGAAGYLAAVTTQAGPVTPEQDPLLWQRIRVSRGDGKAAFAAKLDQALAP